MITQLHVYIGGSGSGKTTLIQNTYGESNDSTIDNMRVSVTDDNVVLLGWYNVDKRCKGCDTLSMAIIDKLIPFVDERMQENIFKTIVVDGDRINNAKFFDFLMKYKDRTKIFWLDVTLDTLYKRMPECNKTFVKTTKTKTDNIMQQYKHHFDVMRLQEKVKEWW